MLAGDVVLHLHSLEYGYFLTCLHGVAHLHAELYNLTGQGCSNNFATYLLGGFGGLYLLLLGCFGSLGGFGSSIALFLHLGEVVFCYCGEELEQEFLFLILGQTYATCILQYGVGLALVLRGVVGDSLACAGDLQTELGIDLHGSATILTLNEVYELGGGGSIFVFAFLECDSAANSLRTNNLAGGGYQRRQTGIQTYRGDELHCGLEQVLALESLELCYHIGVHTAGDLGFLYELIGFGEAEVVLNLVASIHKSLLVNCVGSFHCAVELCLDIGGYGVGEGVEGVGELLHCVVGLKLLADTEQLGVDFGHSLHIHFQFHIHLLAEEVNELDSGGCGATCEVPDVGIDDVHTCCDSCHNRCQTVAGGAVGVEVYGNRNVGLDSFDEVVDSLGRNQTTHILDGDHICAESCELFSFAYEVVVGEYGLGILLTFEFVEEGELGIFGVYGVADSAVGDAAIFFDIFDGRLHVVHVVESVEDTHNAETAFDSVAREAFDYVVAVGCVAEEVTTARECGEVRNVADSFFDALETIPRVLTEETHYGVGHCAAPNLHCIEGCIFVEGEYALYLILVQTGSECGLLTVTKG